MRKKIGDLVAAPGHASGKKRVFTVCGVVCVTAWAAFAISMALGVAAAARIAMLSVALLVTEGVFWVAATLLGVTVIQLRWKLLGKLLPGRRGDAA